MRRLKMQNRLPQPRLVIRYATVAWPLQGRQNMRPHFASTGLCATIFCAILPIASASAAETGAMTASGAGAVDVPLMLRALVALLMPAGFALLVAGLCRAKNAAHTIFMTLFATVIAVAGFWICGFALSQSNCAAFLLRNCAHDGGVFTNFFLALPFATVATCIPIGAMAERWRLKNFYVYAAFMSMLLYPLAARWVWSNGWLAHLGIGHGVVDVAGSGVVHAVGGLCALAGVVVLGPRLGRYNKRGLANPLPAHNMPLALLGSFLLAVGWLGFNTLRSVSPASSIGLILTATVLAGSGGAIAAAIYMSMRTGKPDPTIVANGWLAGLVASSASAGLIGPTSAVIVGAVAGVLVCLFVNWLDKLFIDDPAGAISVHGLCGLWGLIATGLVANGGDGWNGVAGPVTGLLRGGGGMQLLAQIIGCVVLIVWAFGVPWLFFKFIDRLVPMRVQPETEVEGLDIRETGVQGYPDVQGSS
jgi:Amt family ammonium transporter